MTKLKIDGVAALLETKKIFLNCELLFLTVWSYNAHMRLSSMTPSNLKVVFTKTYNIFFWKTYVFSIFTDYITPFVRLKLMVLKKTMQQVPQPFMQQFFLKIQVRLMLLKNSSFPRQELKWLSILIVPVYHFLLQLVLI